MHNKQYSQHNKKKESIFGHILAHPRILASVTVLLLFNETYIDMLVRVFVRLYWEFQKVCEYTFFLFILVSSHSYASRKSHINRIVL